jgi:hypothetical protein
MQPLNQSNLRLPMHRYSPEYLGPTQPERSHRLVPYPPAGSQPKLGPIHGQKQPLNTPLRQEAGPLKV